MLSVLSPAKKLLADYDTYPLNTSTPHFGKKTNELARLMKTKSSDDLGQLMDLSADLSLLNYTRYQDFSLRFPGKLAYPAMFLFQGDVYQGLQANTWGQPAIEFAQDHLGILSGLYGLLKPLDLIQPYRLEMGTRLENPLGTNLYDFWCKSVTRYLNDLLSQQNNPVLINLASQEYFKAVDEKKLHFPIVTVNFYEQQGSGRKMVGIFAKKARGMMAKFLMENQIDKVDDLKSFNASGYRFDEISSTDKQIDFVRLK